MYKATASLFVGCVCRVVRSSLRFGQATCSVAMTTTTAPLQYAITGDVDMTPVSMRMRSTMRRMDDDTSYVVRWPHVRRNVLLCRGLRRCVHVDADGAVHASSHRIASHLFVSAYY